MAPKRPNPDANSSKPAKKPNKAQGVRVEHLADGPWRRKSKLSPPNFTHLTRKHFLIKQHTLTRANLLVIKEKKENSHQTKLQKQYAKIKASAEEEKRAAREQKAAALATPAYNDKNAPNDNNDGETLHPTRQLMLKDEEAAQTGAAPSDEAAPDGQRRRTRRPGYYDKQLEKAEQKRKENEERAAEAQRRREDRERKLAERERYKRVMKKTWGRDGKKKLGRESGLLLERVKKMVEEK